MTSNTSQKSKTHIFTGATGFVGSSIVLELLQNDASCHIDAIVRPVADKSPTERLQETLFHVARLNGHGDQLDQAIASRCRGVAGHLLEPGCGVDIDGTWQNAEIWHCAASLQYLDKHAEAINATNVEGTKNVLALAHEISARCFNHVSTAYVAGMKVGQILEQKAQNDQWCNNEYERSKIRAEKLVQGAEGLPHRILRPSIVIGHSTTRAALNYNGLYGFVRGLAKFREALDEKQKGISDTLKIKIRADSEATLNFVPVDLVARDAALISIHDAPEGIYHLTTETPLSARKILEVVFNAAGMQRPEFVDRTAGYSPIDQKFSKVADFYASYFLGEKKFSRENTNQATRSTEGGAFTFDEAKLAHFCQWYLDTLSEEKEAALSGA